MATVAYERWSLTRGSKYSDLTSKPFGILENWLQSVEPRFNEVTEDGPNLFVKWRVRYIENFDVTNLRGNDQNVRYITCKVIVND